MARRIAILATLALCTSAFPAPVRVAKLKYGGGGDWYSNQSSLPNLIAAVRERTTIDIAREPGTVTPADRELFSYPYIFATGHGRIRFTEEEATALREYLLRGGFLHVDDNYGMDPHFREAVKVLFPDRELVELPFDHAIYHCFYDFPQGLPKIHEHHGGPPHGYAILDKGRVVLFYTYNTDLGDGWESPEVHKDPPETREAALRMGVNILQYALTH
jgi:hypothetical protein